MTLRLVGVAAALLAVLTTSATATPSTSSRLGAAADAVIAAGGPGVVVFVRDHHRTTVVVRGYPDIATERPASSDDHFRVGSVSKSFVSAIVMQLYAEHRLGLDDSVEKYLPGLMPNGEAITIRDLLWHRSGLFDFFYDQRVVAPYLAGHFDHVWGPRQLVELAVKHKPLFPPGEPGHQRYTNTGYVLLGLIIERVTGHPYATEVRQRITKPLGLRDTSFDMSTRLPAPYAHGYSKMFDGSLRDTSGMSGSVASFTGGHRLHSSRHRRLLSRAPHWPAHPPPSRRPDGEKQRVARRFPFIRHPRPGALPPRSIVQPRLGPQR
jgi:D-alanyl-D-alanine carboxypeptidase